MEISPPKLSFCGCPFVGDEESGEEGNGISAGVAHWTEKVQSNLIPRPDFAIYVGPTKLSIYTVQIGLFIVDVKTTGKSAYFGRADLVLDAVKATHLILSSVWEHAKDGQGRRQLFSLTQQSNHILKRKPQKPFHVISQK